MPRHDTHTLVDHPNKKYRNQNDLTAIHRQDRTDCTDPADQKTSDPSPSDSEASEDHDRRNNPIETHDRTIWTREGAIDALKQILLPQSPYHQFYSVGMWVLSRGEERTGHKLLENESHIPLEPLLDEAEANGDDVYVESSGLVFDRDKYESGAGPATDDVAVIT